MNSWRTPSFALSRPFAWLPDALTFSWLGKTSKIVIAVLIALAFLLVLNGDPHSLFAGCYALFLLIVGYSWFKLMATDRDAKAFLPNIFALAFGIRALAAAAINATTSASIQYDSYYYELYGHEWSDYWHKLSVSRPIEMYPSEHLYSVVVGIQYFLSGDAPLAPILTNSFLGALIPVVVYGIARRTVGGEKVGRVAAVFATFQYSMIVWSAIAMRDIIIIFFLSLVLKEVLLIVSRFAFAPVIRSFMWLAVIYAFRPYVVLFTILAVGIAYTLILSKKASHRILIASTFISLLGAIILVAGVRTLVASVLQSQTEQLDMTRQVIEYADPHAYGVDVSFRSPIDIVKFLPSALFNFWAGPLLFVYPVAQAIVGLNGVATWYFIYWFGFQGYLKLRGQSKAMVVLVIYCVVGSVLLSLICGNWAECVRLRSMLSMPIEILAAVGWVRRKERTVASAVLP